MKTIILSTLLSGIVLTASAQSAIKVNQIGYQTNEQKIAVMEPSVKAKSFSLKDAKGKTVWSGKAIRTLKSPFNDKVRQVVDFSKVSQPGQYTLVAGKNRQPVTISENPYSEVSKAALKAFYLQRTGVEIDKEYAGESPQKILTFRLPQTPI